jgi:predicted metal-dependent phosphoesterase TrpH
VKLKIDLHCHSRFSADGIADPDEMVAEAKRKGLNGFAITDHNTCECVDYFLEHGYMREDGEPVDNFLIIPGQEITTSAGHLLALGVYLPDLKGIPPSEAITLIHQKHGIAIPPHPFDLFRAGIREAVLDELNIDAIEVFNAATTFKRYNRLAYEYAQRKKLPMTAGSDAHHEAVLGVAYTILTPKKFNMQSVLESIKTAAGLQQKYITPKEALRKTFHNVFRFKNYKTVKSSKKKLNQVVSSKLDPL